KRMARYKSELRDGQWEKSRTCSPNPTPHSGVAANPFQIVPMLRGFCGLYTSERSGKTSPSNTFLPVPVASTYASIGNPRCLAETLAGFFVPTQCLGLAQLV